MFSRELCKLLLDTNTSVTCRAERPPLGSLVDIFKAVHKYGAHMVLPHVSLAKLQMLTHWFRGTSGKLLIAVVTDMRLYSHIRCFCVLSHTQTHTHKYRCGMNT